MKLTDGYCWQIKCQYEPEYSAEVFDYTAEVRTLILHLATRHQALRA